MFLRRITRFRSRRVVQGQVSRWRRFQLRGGAVLLTLSMLAIGGLLFWVPTVWAFFMAQQINSDLGVSLLTCVEKIESHWLETPTRDDFRKGDKAAIKEYLGKQPLVVAVLDRGDDRTLWIKKGNGLEPATGTPEEAMYRSWIDRAMAEQRFTWIPPQEADPNADSGPAIVLLGDRWVTVKRWKIGSPAVEQALQAILGPKPLTRFGICRPGGVPSNPTDTQAWGAEPNLQVDRARAADPSYFSWTGNSTAFGDWELVAVPFRQHDVTLRLMAFRRSWLVASACALMGVSLALGLWLRHRAKQKAILDADRMASLTHSMKTPLAILKFRCDSIRLGRLSPDQTDAELIKLGEEVDHLTLIIENGLAAVRGVSEGGPMAPVEASWLRSIASDLAPAFEAEGRTLRLELAQDQGKSNLPSLRAALFTLLENALYHGQGEVAFTSSRVRGRLQIQVRDEGPGLERHQLEALGKPFLRLRQPKKEGFRKEGQGLGLSLLCQVAEREGWGLAFSTAPGKGFTAILDIQAS